MPINMTMPRLSDAMQHAAVTWRVDVGQSVAIGELLGEISVEHGASVGLFSEIDGKVSAILASPGVLVPVGAAIITIEPAAPTLQGSAATHSEASRITATVGICGGRPRVRGTRIRVIDVLDMLASGMSEADIIRDYPSLTREDIAASLRYVRGFADMPLLGAA